jgi:hypothetical protein
MSYYSHQHAKFYQILSYKYVLCDSSIKIRLEKVTNMKINILKSPAGYVGV